ncbi:MAG: PfkB family carbohydrate kinase [Sutterella wadsworthensis]
MAVLNIGSLNLDYVYRVDHFVRPGETLAASHRAVHAGGKGLNQSVALARAGATVLHAGCVGADGGMLLEVLKGEGVDVSMLAVHESEASGHTFIQVTEDGENGILYYPGTNGRVTVESMLLALDACEKDDIVMLQNELPDTAGLIEAAGLMALLERRYPDVNLILTLGSRGACGRVPGAEPFFVPAVKMKAVDTTGAGDTFAGYAVAALAAGEDLRTAMNRAAKASAISVTREAPPPRFREGPRSRRSPSEVRQSIPNTRSTQHEHRKPEDRHHSRLRPRLRRRGRHPARCRQP